MLRGAYRLAPGAIASSFRMAIQWPLAGVPVVADKDRRGTPLAAAETFE